MLESTCFPIYSETFYKNTCMPLRKAATTATMVRDCVAGRDKFLPFETVPQDLEKQPDLPEKVTRRGRPPVIDPADARVILQHPDVKLMRRNKRVSLPKLRELCRTDVVFAQMAAKRRNELVELFLLDLNLMNDIFTAVEDLNGCKGQNN